MGQILRQDGRGGPNDDGRGTDNDGLPLHRRRRGAISVGQDVRVDRSLDRPGDRPVAFGEAEDVDRAVAAGRAAFESGSWSKAAPGHRAAVMRQLADLIRDDADRIGRDRVDVTRASRSAQAIAEVESRGRLLHLFRRPCRAAERHDVSGGRGLLRVLDPGAVRRRRRDQPMELPLPARLLEDRAGARRRQLDRAQDGRADASLHGRARSR